MKSRCTPLLLAALLLAGPAALASNNYLVQAPVLGHVFNPDTGTLHRIDGIPGASSIGDALALDFLIARAAISPVQDYAIVADENGQAWIVNLEATPPSAVLLEGALAGAEGAMISPTGARAALLAPSSGQIQLLGDLTGAPAAGETVNLPAGVGTWTAFAISDRGVVLAAAAQANAGALYATGSGGNWSRIGALTSGSDLAFFAGSNDALVADQGANEVLLIRDVVARRQTSVIASVADDLHSPLGVEATADGRYVAVAVPGGVASIPLFGGAPRYTECACAPTGLVPLAGGSAFQLTEDLNLPLRVVEVGEDSRTLFVPALAAADLTR